MQNARPQHPMTRYRSMVPVVPWHCLYPQIPIILTSSRVHQHLAPSSQDKHPYDWVCRHSAAAIGPGFPSCWLAQREVEMLRPKISQRLCPHIQSLKYCSREPPPCRSRSFPSCCRAHALFIRGNCCQSRIFAGL